MNPRLSVIPTAVTLEFCPVCGRQRISDEHPPECHGAWRSNYPNKAGKLSDHDPTPYAAVIFTRPAAGPTDKEKQHD